MELIENKMLDEVCSGEGFQAGNLYRYDWKEQAFVGSKPKSKTYIVLEGGHFGQPRTVGRYKVGARNEKEAEEILKNYLGKHAKVRVYYEEKKDLVAHGEVICESSRKEKNILN